MLEELGIEDGPRWQLLRFLLGVVCPIAIAILFIVNLRLHQTGDGRIGKGAGIAPALEVLWERLGRHRAGGQAGHAVHLSGTRAAPLSRRPPRDHFAQINRPGRLSPPLGIR